MKKHINFSDESTAYLFMLDGDDGKLFEIGKDTLVFSSDDFYRLFFQGLDEKPDYELVNTGDDLSGQAKHIFDTVDAILKKACDSINADWFKTPDEQTDNESDSADDALS